MKSKALAAAALSLALTPCICLFACTPADQNNPNAAEAKLNAQVTGTENTYTNIYGRAERNGGLFAEVSKSSASVVRAAYALADGDEEQTDPFDTSALISQLITTVKEIGSLSKPMATESYVLDLFGYTQIASHLITAEGKTALTKSYSVDYDIDDDFKTNFNYVSNPYGWMSKIPEEMSIAGFDEASHKANIVFRARDPRDKEKNVENFEKVNSEMYYISDNDFGYAQFTYRYNDNGTLSETGFDYFSMKDKEMLEINISAAGIIRNVYTFNSTYYDIAPRLNSDQKQAIKSCFTAIENAFTARTDALEQQNLALGVEAGIKGIETKEVNGKTVYVKGKAETPYHVTFDYEVLNKML